MPNHVGEPTDFGRLFADPEGDFYRVQDALDRPTKNPTGHTADHMNVKMQKSQLNPAALEQ